MTKPFHCPFCRCTLEKDAPAPTPPAAANGRATAKYNFDALEVGDKLTLPLSQNSVSSRLNAWKQTKSRPDRKQRLFKTRRVDANTTTVWRTK